MFNRNLVGATALAMGLAAAPLAAQAQWGSTTHSNSTTDSKTTGSSQSTTTSQTRQGSWGNNTVTETTSQTTGTSSSRTNSTTRGTSVTTPSWNPPPNNNPGWNNNSGWNSSNRSNNNDSTAAAVGALIGVIGAIAEDREAQNAPRLQPEQAYGQWVASSNGWGGTKTCEVELSPDKAFLNQGFKLKPQKCWNGPFGQLFAWRPYDGAVALIKHDGQTLAVMRGDGNRLSGRTSDGAQLVMHRPGY